MKKNKINKLSPVSLKILKWGLAAVTIMLIYIVAYRAGLREYDAARLSLQFSYMMEHFAMSLLLIVGGALLFDIAAREKKRGD